MFKDVKSLAYLSSALALFFFGEMRSIVVASWTALLLSILAAAEPALAGDSFILATGRRDPRIYAIDFNAALRTSNDRTPNAIVSRSKTQVDRLAGPPGGVPRT